MDYHVLQKKLKQIHFLYKMNSSTNFQTKFKIGLHSLMLRRKLMQWTMVTALVQKKLTWVQLSSISKSCANVQLERSLNIFNSLKECICSLKISLKQNLSLKTLNSATTSKITSKSREIILKISNAHCQLRSNLLLNLKSITTSKSWRSNQQVRVIKTIIK